MTALAGASPIDEPESASPDALVAHYALAAASVGLVPVAAIDLTALTALQLKMVHALCGLYGVPFSASAGRATLAALVGAGAPVGAMGLLSAAKAVPLFGSTAGMIGMWLLGGASTYALGQTLRAHFEAGGTLADASGRRLGRVSARAMRRGLRVVRERFGSTRSDAAEPVEREDPAHEHGHEGCAGHDHGHHDHDHHDHAHHDHDHDHDHHDHDHAHHDHDHGHHDHDHGHHDHDHADGQACCGHDHSAEELSRYRGRVIVGATTLGGLGAQALLLPGLIAPGANFAVAAIATVAIGRRYITSLVDAVRTRSLDTDVLVGTATVASLVLGQGVTALGVVVLLNLGEWAEAATLDRSHRAIADLLAGRESDPVTRLVAVDGGEIEVTTRAGDLLQGDIVRVRQGSRLPADGVVRRGRGSVDQAQITGESRLAGVDDGDPVYAGSVLVVGDLEVRCEQVGADTVVGRIMRTVNDAERNRPPLQRIGEAFAQRFVPVSLGAAVIVLAVTLDPTRALTLLLVACPCAVGLSTPTAVSASVGVGARQGILVRGGQHLEAVARADVIVFDKTGTLTRAEPEVIEVAPLAEGWTTEAVIALAAAAESHAEHPIARAIVAHARRAGIEFTAAETFQLDPGRGARAEAGERVIAVGSPRLMTDADIPVSDEAAARIEACRETGASVVCVAADGRLVGLIGLRDRLRDGAAETVARLAAERRVLLMSGDHPAAVAAVAEAVGIDEWHADLLPDEKRALIARLQHRGHRVMMVGDGVNDAPALATADVGVSLGTNCAEMAVSVADIAIAADDLGRLEDVIAIGRSMTGRIKENYGMAVAVNGGGMVVAAMGLLGPIGAVVLHNLSSLAVIANSYRIARQPGASAEAAPTAPAPAPA